MNADICPWSHVQDSISLYFSDFPPLYTNSFASFYARSPYASFGFRYFIAEGDQLRSYGFLGSTFFHLLSAGLR